MIRYGERMERLMTLIEKNSHKFRRRPVGPVGSYLELSPDANPQEALVVETELYNSLTTFIVETFEEQKTFNAMQQSVGTRFKVVVSK